MRIQISGVGRHRGIEIEWPEGWPVPRVDDAITTSDDDTVYVRHVDWYPQGEAGGDPFVYVVVGPRNIHI